MSLKQRIWLLPVLVAVIFAVGVSVVAWCASRTTATIAQLGGSDYPYMSGVAQFAGDLEAYVSSVQGAVAEGEKDRLKEIATRAAGIRTRLTKLDALPGQAAKVKALVARFDEYAAASQETAAVLLGAKPGDAAQAVPRTQAAYRALETLVADARKQAEAGVDDAIAGAHSGVQAGLVATIGCAVIVVLALSVGSAVLVRSIWRQIGGEPEYAQAMVQRMAGGDLSSKVDVVGDRANSLLGAVREMGRGLSTIVASVRASSETMATASTEIASGNQDLSARTEQTASSLQETASSMAQLTGTLLQSADAARQANQLASTAAEDAARGGAVVSQVVTTMNDIHAASKKIADIIGVMDGIAFQTNILALNAAVEAARAGEQGRGFAVVASEVRSLAQRSAASAKEIKGLIGASVDKVESGSKLVVAAGTTMEQIVGSVRRVQDIVAEMSAASVEQSEGVGHINTAVGKLDQMTQQNAALVEQSAAAAESLRDQTTSLVNAVSVFQLQAG